MGKVGIRGMIAAIGKRSGWEGVKEKPGCYSEKVVKKGFERDSRCAR